MNMRRSTLPLALILAAALPPTVRAQVAGPYDTGIIVSGSWLQATMLPLDRDAMQSAAFTVGLRRQGWSAEAGWLRIANTLSTIQGGTLSIGRVMSWKSVEIIPSIAALGGMSYASSDSTGFDWTDGSGAAGHTARFTYSDGPTFGGSIGLTAEVPIYRALGARASASQWFFGGSPLADDRGRTLVGIGLMLRVGGGR